MPSRKAAQVAEESGPASGAGRVLQHQPVKVVFLQRRWGGGRDKGEREPGPIPGLRWRSLGFWGLGTGCPHRLTLAWYSMMKGWDLCESFSWDR